LIIIRKIAY